MYDRLRGSLTLGLTSADVGSDQRQPFVRGQRIRQCSGLEKTARHAGETSSWRCCSMLQA
jgi:hypothetical protein